MGHSELNRAYSLLRIKSVDEDQRVIEGIATTPTPDRVGDIVEPDGAEFKLPLPLLWQHRSSEPIGQVTDAKVTPDGIAIVARLAKIDEPGVLRDRLDEAWQSIKTGLVGGLSIGFSALEEARIKDTFSFRYIRWLWLELSAVTIPANAEASITAIKSIDTAQRAASGQRIGGVRLIPPPGSSGASSTKSYQQPLGRTRVPVQEEGPEMSKTIAEQITALEQTRMTKAARMADVMQKSVDEGRSTDAAEQEEFDTLQQELDALDGDLKRFKALERAAAVAAKPVGEVHNAIDAAQARATTVTGGQHSPVVAVKHEEKLEKGIAFTRFVACVALGKGSLLQAVEIAKGQYGENHELVGLMKYCSQRGTSIITKAPVAGATTGDTAWAGSLVALYQRYTGDFVDYLRPMTILGKLGQGDIPGPTRIPFNVNIAGQNAGATAYWVGESQPKPVTRAGFYNVNFGWAKVAAIMIQSEELFRLTDGDSERYLRDELAKAVAERLDVDLVDPNKAAVPGVSPASITNGVTPIASTGNDADAIREDVNLLGASFDAVNIGLESGVWLMGNSVARRLSSMRNALGQREFPDMTPRGGMFEGYPVVVSNYMTDDSNGHDVILMNASDIWLADDGQVTVDASREASLQMQDNPTNDAANGGNPTATTMVSLWQTNNIGLRAERFVNWAKRRPQSVQMLGNVNWGEPGSS